MSGMNKAAMQRAFIPWQDSSVLAARDGLASGPIDADEGEPCRHQRTADVIPITRQPKIKLGVGTTLYLDVASLVLCGVGADGTKLVRDSAGKWRTEWLAARHKGSLG